VPSGGRRKDPVDLGLALSAYHPVAVWLPPDGRLVTIRASVTLADLRLIERLPDASSCVDFYTWQRTWRLMTNCSRRLYEPVVTGQRRPL
jgi:hypothetical protein